MANETTLNMTLLLRRAEFADSCKLQVGEPGFNTKTHEFKIGQADASGNLIEWKDLPLANETQIKAWIEAVRSDLQGKLDALDNTYVTDTDFLSYKQSIEALLGTFSIGTGDGQYADIKAYIDAMDDAAEAAANLYTDGKLGTKNVADAEGKTTVYGTIKAEADARIAGDNEIKGIIGSGFTSTNTVAKTIGTTNDTKETASVYGAIKAEAYAREQADTTITNKIGNIGDGTVASRLQAADNAAAGAQATAEAAGTAAGQAQTDINTHKADKTNPHDVTAAQVGLGNVENKSTATIKEEFTGAIAKDDEGFVTGGAVYAADKALDDKISDLETRIGNVTNIMNFRGAVETFEEITNPVEGDVITFKKEVKNGDTVTVKAGSEWVYSNGAWVEIGTASASDAAIADLQSRMGAAEGEIDQAQADIIALGTNKLDKSTYETYITGKSMSDADLKKYAEDEADDAQSAAEAKAAELDTALHTVISKEIDDDVAAAIAAEVTRSDAKAKELADAALAEAKSDASAKDATLKTTLEGTNGDASSAKTIAGAKKYAEEKAAAAESAAKTAVIGASTDGKDANTVYGAKAFATDAVNTAKNNLVGTADDAKTANTIYGAKAFATDAASTAKSEAISAVVGTASDDADDDTIKGVRKAIAAGDSATLTSAQTYADTAAANAVKNNIKAGNADIVIDRPTTGTDAGKTVISHKDYSTGTFTKTPDPLTKTNDTYFFKSITVNNGHVTGGEMKSLAEALSAMTFIFDGGTSAN